MTVAEMIEALSMMPQDAQLVQINGDGYWFNPSWPSIDKVTSETAGINLGLELGQEIVVI